MAENSQTVTVEPVIITDENGVSLTVYTAQDGDKRGENEGAMLAEFIYNTALESMEVGQAGQQEASIVQVVSSQLEEVEHGEASEVNSSVIGDDDGIWRQSRLANRENDLLATKTLLQIIKQDDISAKLNNKKTKKKTVWNEIAQKMCESGFILHDRAAERCFQKYRNLEYRYKEYTQSFTNPNKVRRSTPEFLDELEDLFSVKHYNHELEGDPLVDSLLNRKNSAKRIKLQEPYATINQIREDQKQRDSEYHASQEKFYKDVETREQKRFIEMKQLLEKQHKERMAATYSLIKALKSSTSD